MNDQTQATPEAQEQAKVQIRPDLNRYVRDKSGNGKRTHRTDDFIARTLAGKSIEQIKEGAAKLGVEYAKWEGLNIGQQRMLIGNKLRHFIERTKTLGEGQVTEVFGEPCPEYDAEAAAAAKAAAEAEKAKKGEVSAAPAASEQPATHDASGKPKKTVSKKK